MRDCREGQCGPNALLGWSTHRDLAPTHPRPFSEISKVATNYACELAAKFDAELHLLHVNNMPTSVTSEFALGFDLPELIRESRAAAKKSLAGVLDSKWAEGRPVERSVVEGNPFVEIIRYAREKAVDLIVMGTHGRSGLAHVLLGSVAENVVRKASCPVLTVRPEGHQFVMP